MFVTVIALMRNEEIILPFFLRHYQRMADRIVLFDNQSTDRTLEIARACPIVRLESYSTGGTIRDDIHAQMKSEAYRGMEGDWFIVVDCDEFIHCADLRGELAWCGRAGYGLPFVTGYGMVGDVTPRDDGVSLLTDLVKTGVRQPDYDKRAVIHRSVRIMYKPGAHDFYIEGDCPGVIQPCNGAEGRIKLLHYKMMSLEYALERTRRTALSSENISHGWGMETLDQDFYVKRYAQFKSQAEQVIP